MEFRDLKRQYKKLKPEIDKAIFDVINDSNFILGKQVSELEDKLATYVGRKYCISCANGTDALILALMVMGIGKGDAVLVPDFTYIATASSVAFVGATPIFVDIDLDTFNMSTKSLEDVIKKIHSDGKYKLKAIIPVDLFGLPADYNNILAIAQKYNLIVIEDAAQGFGGSINGKKACSFGGISCTSFFPAKPLGCYGDGGAIFTDEETVYEKLISLRSNGKSKIDKYDNILIGMNSRLDTIQAAILKVKLKAFIDYELEAVNNVYKWYTEKLSKKVKIPIIPNGFYSSFAQYTVLCKDKNERDDLKIRLNEYKIPSMIYYPKCMHEQKCFYNINKICYNNINSLEAKNRVLSLPMHPYLTKTEVNNICEVLLQ